MSYRTSLFIKFAEALCADETDFDFLTNPQNAEYYKKLQKFAAKFQKQIPSYITILEKICDNKTLGLYQEFQEVNFFFDEFSNSQNSNFANFFENHKRVLKLQTQKIFNEFIAINLFDQTQKILEKNKTKIGDESALKCYVYGALFFNLNLSNANENLLLKHIEFCVQHLAKKNAIKFGGLQKEKYLVQYADLETRLELCFTACTFENKQKLIPLLKDYSLNDAECVSFCESLKKIFAGEILTIESGDNVKLIEKIIFASQNKNEAILFLQALFIIAKSEKINLDKVEKMKNWLASGNIINHVVRTFHNNRLKIVNKTTLCFYVYGELYYNQHLPNKEENLVIQYIETIIQYFIETGSIIFEQIAIKKYFLNLNLDSRFRLLFQIENIENKEKSVTSTKGGGLKCEPLKAVIA